MLFKDKKRLMWLFLGAPWVLALLAGANLVLFARGDYFALPSTPNTAVVSSSVEAVSSGIPRAEALMLIHQATLFGVAESHSVTEAVEPIETRLDLTLVATFTHADPNLASALIADQGGTALKYRIGDTVAGDGTLEEIRSGSVVLNRNNRREALKLLIITTE